MRCYLLMLMTYNNFSPNRTEGVAKKAMICLGAIRTGAKAINPSLRKQVETSTNSRVQSLLRTPNIGLFNPKARSTQKKEKKGNEEEVKKKTERKKKRREKRKET